MWWCVTITWIYIKIEVQRSANDPKGPWKSATHILSCLVNPRNLVKQRVSLWFSQTTSCNDFTYVNLNDDITQLIYSNPLKSILDHVVNTCFIHISRRGSKRLLDGSKGTVLSFTCLVNKRRPELRSPCCAPNMKASVLHPSGCSHR